MPDQLPPCGIYRTTVDVGEVPAGRLVYFHNHGEPGPGLYLPEAWRQNRARFAARGSTLPTPWEGHARSLEALPAEGFYRVTAPFFCCDKRCRAFEAEQLVQLGYNGAGEAILFVPELGGTGVTLPSSGSAVGRPQLAMLAPVKVAERHEHGELPSAPGGMLH